jgi:hypothetical protein
MNEDFSFVRFLKVVRTLYESSTFTQLGKTVGSALSPLAVPVEKQDYNQDKEKDKGQSENETEVINRSGSTVFDALLLACSPARQKRRSKEGPSKSHDNNNEDEKKDELSPQGGETLFERVINCTLIGHNEDDYSDEDTFKTRTYDEDHSCGDGGSFTDPEESFDTRSLTDDEYSRRRSRRYRRR